MQSALAHQTLSTLQTALSSDTNQDQLLNAKIVIVDDEPTTMEVVKAYLEGSGYRNFELIEDSSQAVETLETERPDILLLDLIMPGVSGFDLLKTIRQHPALGHLPVIILTSSSDNQDKLKALELGATDFLAKPVDPSELRLRVRNTLAAKAYQDQLTFYDPLTKLPNRHLFMPSLEWALAECQRNRENLALLSIELDQFDKIRDTMGLEAGDEILLRFTKRFKNVVTGIDMMGRIEKDEYVPVNLFHFADGVFTLLLHRIPNERGAATVASCLLEAIRAVLKIGNAELYMTASIGIATFPHQNADGLGLLKLATSARDHVKNTGGNNFQFSSDAINTQFQRRIAIEARLRKALDRNELRVFYQPKLEVHTNRITGFEALLRWQVNQTTMVPPYKFIPIAEETGLIIPMGEWVLREACRQLAAWQQAGSAPLTMSVNLSPAQFKYKDMSTVFKKIVEDNGVSPRQMTLEVTEGLFLSDVESKIEAMHRLRAVGFKISIDDFGTGYSSLSYLRKLPIDELKIDRSFFVDLFKDTKSRALVSTLIYLARSLNLTTVSEGVETQEQLRFLQKGACDHYQGFLFSPPIPAEQVEKMLAPVRQS